MIFGDSQAFTQHIPGVIKPPDLEDFMYAYALGEKVALQLFYRPYKCFLVLLNYTQSLIRRVLNNVLVLVYMTFFSRSDFSICLNFCVIFCILIWITCW